MELITLFVCLMAVLFSVLLAMVTWDIRSKKADRSQSYMHALRHYASLRAMRVLGSVMSRKLEASTCNVVRAQTEFLMERLKEEADTTYGKLYDFATMRSVDEFRSRHPLTNYDHYAPYVQRMMDGEENVLTKAQPVIFGVSSGTSGTGNKTIPMLRRQQTVFFFHGVSVLYTSLISSFPVASQMLRKSLKIFYNPTWRSSKAGILIGPNSSSPKSNKSLLHMYTTPEAGYDIPTEPEALYVHLLFALVDKHLGSIEGNFASLVYNAMHTLYRTYRQLAADVSTGTLNKDLNIHVDVRAQLEKLLQPDPDRGKEIVDAFSEERGGIVGVCKRIWPELYIVLTVDTGSFAPYGERLKETFLKGVPIYSALYAATEGLVGINLWPLELPTRYLLHPAVQFFEFIPVELCEEDQPQTLLLHQVEVGKEYEVVLTNISGLYRYRLGDLVRVAGFKNQCPTIEFLCRIGQFLNVRGEKICERMFYDALTTAMAHWSGLTLVDYCCAESVIVDDVIDDNVAGSPCYHVFLELEGTSQDLDMLTLQRREKLDRCLCDKSYPYASFRKKGSIGVLQVHVVQLGAFRNFRNYVISSSCASSNQFKVPRVIKKKEYVEFLWNQSRHKA